MIKIPGFTVAIKCFGNSEIVQDETGEVVVVFYGQLYDGVCATQLASRYKNKGISSIECLNGSFAILIVDKSQEKIFIVIDRLSSLKLFKRQKGDTIFISSVLKYLVSEQLTLDPVGLAWYLSNGYFQNNRTIFNGISCLDRATTYIYQANKTEEKVQYWHYQFNYDDEPKDLQGLKDELATLLIECVRKRIPNNSRSFISLSAGYDSSGIIGILSEKLGYKDVTAFSYGLSESDESSDASVAKQLAEMCGIAHRFCPSYDGDLIGAIERNALWGDGRTHFCDESLVWSGFSNVTDYQNHPLFVGDECFGERDADLSSEADVLTVCKIRKFDCLSNLDFMFSDRIYEELLESHSEDIAIFFKRAPQTSNLHDLKDFIYLDQRKPHFLLPWRENFAGRTFQVQIPFFDNSIIDFTQKIPTAWRIDKRLYKETIVSMLPDIFAVGRSRTHAYVPGWNNEINRNVKLIQANYINNKRSSLLDEYIDPILVNRLLSINKKTPDKIFGIFCKRILKVGRKAKSEGTNQAVQFKVSRAVFLLRYLVIKRYIEIAKESSMLHL